MSSSEKENKVDISYNVDITTMSQSHASGARVGLVALHCLSQLLRARPGFNFSANVISALLSECDSPLVDARNTVVSCFSDVLRAESKGEEASAAALQVGYSR